MNDWHELRAAGYEHWQSLLDEATQQRQARRTMPAAPPAWRAGVATVLVRLAAWFAPAVAPPPAREGTVPADGTL